MVWKILQKLTNEAMKIENWQSTPEQKHMKNSLLEQSGQYQSYTER